MKKLVLLALISPVYFAASADTVLNVSGYKLSAGDPSLSGWLLPEPDHPVDNLPSEARIALGRMLFFDPRLSSSGDLSCGSCHNPKLGWSDGLPTAVGANGKVLKRATPTILNSAFNHLQMWDGRFADLETQVEGPLTSADEMNMQPAKLLEMLRADRAYGRAFARAYPSQPISMTTVSRAIAAFERTVISADSPFDRWVRGDSSAMTVSQIRGFAVFLDQDKGNCVACHAPPNFSDDGYHNIGLSALGELVDNGRFDQVPVRLMRGAFRTPTLRDIENTQPYFHDGSAETLDEVMDHYAKDIEAQTLVSPTLKPTKMSLPEREYLLDFLGALATCSGLDESHNQPKVCVASTRILNSERD